MDWQRSVRDERFKLIEYCVEGARHTQLFDLKADPYEEKNLVWVPECQGTLKRLRSLLEDKRVKYNDGNVPYEFSNAQGESFWKTYSDSKN